jgi:hypothetical protein
MTRIGIVGMSNIVDLVSLVSRPASSISKALFHRHAGERESGGNIRRASRQSHHLLRIAPSGELQIMS